MSLLICLINMGLYWWFCVMVKLLYIFWYKLGKWIGKVFVFFCLYKVLNLF